MGLAYSGGVFQVISLKSDPSRRLLWALTGLGTCVADARHQHLSGLGLLPGCGEKSSSALPRLRVCQGSPEKHSKRMRVCKYYEVCFKESAHTITEAAGSQSCTGAGRLRTRGGPDVAVQIRRTAAGNMPSASGEVSLWLYLLLQLIGHGPPPLWRAICLTLN